MVIEQKAIVGKLKKFTSKIQEFFSLGSNIRSCQTSGLFLPFGCTDDVNEEQNDPSKHQRHGNGNTGGINAYGNGEIKHRPPLSQTYPQWKVMCDVQKIHSSQQRKRFKKRTMYILPLGTLDEKEKVERLITDCNQENAFNGVALLHVVKDFMSLFFYGMEIKLLTFQDINSLGFTTRVHDRTGKEQILVTDILDYLKKIRPSDSFCIVGWSSLDLYPSPELNFVLGEACFDSGCAVISFGCYADATKPGAENTFDTLHDKLQNINQASCACDSYTSVKYPHWNCTDLGDEIVWRVLKVLTHEACHLLGMHHCTFFACLMNESSSVVQAQNQPLFLCPVCLRKLHKFLQFPIVTRYKMLKDFMEHHCDIIAGKGQCSVSCDNLTDSTIKCNDLEFLCGVDGVDSPVTKTYEAYTLQKFRNSLNWLDNVLKFIS